jgi:hypothetical protein
MLEKYGFYLLVLGVALAAIGWFWLLVRAFKVRILWGLALLLFPPAAFFFGRWHFRRAIGPLLVLVLGGVVVATPYGLSFYERHFVKLKPYEQRVDGELRLTLTGLKDFDYAALDGRREVAVLQMANADVDDRTLEHLRGLDQLWSLDLNDTRITDKGLRLLADLPQLKELRLARTAISDEGFKKYLAPKESLLKLDLTGTAVQGKTKRDWKKLKSGEREYVD